jgi:hypothetical protein
MMNDELAWNNPSALRAPKNRGGLRIAAAIQFLTPGAILTLIRIFNPNLWSCGFVIRQASGTGSALAKGGLQIRT